MPDTSTTPARSRDEWAYDVTAANFEEKVILQSQSVPVVVDFWARWCGPCRALGPLLEDLADEYGGRFRLAKVDIDKETSLAQQFQVSSIPLVVAISQGELVSHFTGMQNEASVRRFIDRLIPSPSRAVTLKALEPSASVSDRKKWLSEALEIDSHNTLAAAHLAEIYLDEGDEAKAQELVAPLNEASEGWNQAKNVRARLSFAEAARHLPSLAECERKLANDSSDLKLLLDLGLAQAAKGLWKESLESFVRVAEKDPRLGSDDSRVHMVEIFGILGQQHPLTAEYRHRLSSALY